MSGKPPDLQPLSRNRRNVRELVQFRAEGIEITGMDPCNPRLFPRVGVSGSPKRRIGVDREIAIKAGRNGSDACVRSLPFLGRFLKRIVDVLLSCAALLFLWPLLLAIALLVKVESSGPVLYCSLRAGEKGQQFVCYKFRTMIDGADEVKSLLRSFNERQDPFFKIAGDPRVTRLGRVLRRYSLDELPQFWNVLKGDMSLVGPRPHPLDDCARYRPEDYRRLQVKPGITGLWQVIARKNPSFETCMALDLAYIKNWGLWLDFEILLRTVPAVLSGNGE
jgi:lipopolysaccharide/colanic/teichoic acid biosynthesis glycosyltransferase